MAHFYGSMLGSRSERTACGTKQSGFSAHIRGWEVGCRVELSHDNGIDFVNVYRTSGTNGDTEERIASFQSEKDKVQS